MKILFLSRWYPYPPDNGAKLRVYHLLRNLAKENQITLLTFMDSGGAEHPSPEIEALCERVEIVPWKGYNPNSPRALVGLFSLAPRSIVDTYSIKMERRLRGQLDSGAFDLVITSQFSMAAYSRWFGGRPAVFEEVESGIFYEQHRRAATAMQRARFALTWAKYCLYLRSLMRNFQACTVASEQEKQLLQGVIGDSLPVEVIPNGIYLDHYREVKTTPMDCQLIFAGSFRYYPNYEAMRWFLQEVYPRIRSVAPDVSLIITGDHMGLPLPEAEGVRLSGFVDDIRPLVAGSWASLAPLQTGGGTRLKILESMALRTPVIATSKGAEGIEAHPGEEILVADSPDEFAQSVLNLLHNPDLRQRLADNAYRLIQEKYEWSVIAPKFISLIGTIASQNKAKSGRMVR